MRRKIGRSIARTQISLVMEIEKIMDRSQEELMGHIYGTIDPNGNRFLNINTKAVFGNAYGAYVNAASVKARGLGFMSMTDNEIMVNDGNFNNHDIAGAFASDDIDGNMKVSSNTVRITGGINIKDVYGGRIKNGTVSSSAVEITSVKIGKDVYGGYIRQNGKAAGNKVNLTSVTVRMGVYGAWIGDGLASSNAVTINGGTVRGAKLRGAKLRALFPSSVPNKVPRNFVSNSFYLLKDGHNRLYSSRLSSIQEII